MLECFKRPFNTQYLYITFSISGRFNAVYTLLTTVILRVGILR